MLDIIDPYQKCHRQNSGRNRQRQRLHGPGIRAGASRDCQSRTESYSSSRGQLDVQVSALSLKFVIYKREWNLLACNHQHAYVAFWVRRRRSEALRRVYEGSGNDPANWWCYSQSWFDCHLLLGGIGNQLCFYGLRYIYNVYGYRSTRHNVRHHYLRSFLLYGKKQ